MRGCLHARLSSTSHICQLLCHDSPHCCFSEIFSYVIDGELSHADSMGNKEALPRGSVQYMSAGTGVTHSEMNAHPTETVRFLQIWLMPDARGEGSQSQTSIRLQTSNSDGMSCRSSSLCRCTLVGSVSLHIGGLSTESRS
jgi:hypothetical protein